MEDQLAQRESLIKRGSIFTTKSFFLASGGTIVAKLVTGRQERTPITEFDSHHSCLPRSALRRPPQTRPGRASTTTDNKTYQYSSICSLDLYFSLIFLTIDSYDYTEKTTNRATISSIPRTTSRVPRPVRVRTRSHPCQALRGCSVLNFIHIST